MQALRTRLESEGVVGSPYLFANNVVSVERERPPHQTKEDDRPGAGNPAMAPPPKPPKKR